MVEFRVEEMVPTWNGIPYPPEALGRSGGGVTGDFFAGGKAAFERFVAKGYFGKHSSVLDIGCGIGRVAVHFANYLEPPGRYEGFDIEPIRIAWLSENVTPRHPHAHFRYVPLNNTFYNPRAPTRAEDFSLPYETGFDFILLASVFTHLLSSAARNYISEISRLLKLDGCCFMSFYLLNNEKRREMALGTSAYTFSHQMEDCYVELPHNPEAAVAHNEDDILQAMANSGLALKEPIQYGVWSTTQHQDQDRIVVRKAR